MGVGTEINVHNAVMCTHDVVREFTRSKAISSIIMYTKFLVIPESHPLTVDLVGPYPNRLHTDSNPTDYSTLGAMQR